MKKPKPKKPKQDLITLKIWKPTTLEIQIMKYLQSIAGRTVYNIAHMVSTTEQDTEAACDNLVAKGFLQKKEDKYSPIPTILEPEPAQGAPKTPAPAWKPSLAQAMILEHLRFFAGRTVPDLSMALKYSSERAIEVSCADLVERGLLQKKGDVYALVNRPPAESADATPGALAEDLKIVGAVLDRRSPKDRKILMRLLRELGFDLNV